MNISRETRLAQHKNNIRNLEGTFAAEGIKISPATRRNLERIANGQASYQQVLQEVMSKYQKRG